MIDDPTAGGRAALWLVPDGEDHRPALLAAPPGVPSWPGPDGRCWWDAGGLYIPVTTHVAVVPLAGPVHVWTDGAAVVAWGADGSVTVREGAVTVHRHPLERDGLVRRPRLRRGRWEDLRGLPEGAHLSRRVTPWPSGDGLWWQDLGWLYRQQGDGPPSPVAAARATDLVLPGPAGAALLARDGQWIRVIGPDSAGQDILFEADPQVRWSADGRRVAVVDGDDTVVLDTRTGERLSRRPGVPDDVDLSRPPAPPPVVGLTDALVVGPGGRAWRRADGRPTGPPVPPGHLAAPCGGTWVACSPTGDGAWLHPSTGAITATFGVPVRPATGPVSEAIPAGDAVLLVTERGHCWRVRPGRVRPGEAPDSGAAWAESPPWLAALGLNRCVAAGRVALAASEAGALVRLRT